MTPPAFVHFLIPPTNWSSPFSFHRFLITMYFTCFSLIFLLLAFDPFLPSPGYLYSILPHFPICYMFMFFLLYLSLTIWNLFVNIQLTVPKLQFSSCFSTIIPTIISMFFSLKIVYLGQSPKMFMPCDVFYHHVLHLLF